MKLGTIESSKVELPIAAEHPAQKPVEIVRAYQKYPKSEPDHEHFPSAVTEPMKPVDPSSITKPKVLEHLKDADLIEGGQAVFECRLQGHPLTIQWFKGERELKNQYRYKMGYDDRTGVARLVLSTVLEDDADVYTCRASNSIGEALTSAKLIPSIYKNVY